MMTQLMTALLCFQRMARMRKYSFKLMSSKVFEEEIIRRTDMVKTEVSAEPIRLNNFSSQFADLKFLDLPGFIQVSGNESQSSMKHSC